MTTGFPPHTLCFAEHIELNKIKLHIIHTSEAVERVEAAFPHQSLSSLFSGKSGNKLNAHSSLCGKRSNFEKQANEARQEIYSKQRNYNDSDMHKTMLQREYKKNQNLFGKINDFLYCLDDLPRDFDLRSSEGGYSEKSNISLQQNSLSNPYFTESNSDSGIFSSPKEVFSNEGFPSGKQDISSRNKNRLPRLSSLSLRITQQLETLNITSLNIKEWIILFEQYKKQVKKIVYSNKENSFHLTNLLSRKKLKGNLWEQTEHYFMKIPHEFLENEGTNVSFPPLPQILSMHAVNRISAILKMIHYCRDTHIDPKRFKDFRIVQKIQTAKKVARQHDEEKNFGIYKKKLTLLYPNAEEVNYLLRLETDQLSIVLDRFKQQILEKVQEDLHLQSEQKRIEYRIIRIAEKRRYIMEKILEVQKKENLNSGFSSTKLLDDYYQLEPAMKKRRKSEIQKEELLLKFMESKGSPTKPCFSPSKYPVPCETSVSQFSPAFDQESIPSVLPGKGLTLILNLGCGKSTDNELPYSSN